MNEYLTQEQKDELNRTAPERRKHHDAVIKRELERFEKNLEDLRPWPKDPEILIQCAITSMKQKHNRHSRFRGMVLWGMVCDIFCIGSTSAMELCRRFNFDPHEKLK